MGLSTNGQTLIKKITIVLGTMIIFTQKMTTRQQDYGIFPLQLYKTNWLFLCQRERERERERERARASESEVAMFSDHTAI